jgi:hypothetical protein
MTSQRGQPCPYPRTHQPARIAENGASEKNENTLFLPRVRCHSGNAMTRAVYATMASRKTILLMTTTGIALVVVSLLLPSGGSQTSVLLSNGGSVRISTVSTLREMQPGATAQIDYRPPGQKSGTITLLQDFFDGPVLAVPARDTNLLFCLYDHDGRFRLIKFNCSKAFVPFTSTNMLKFIVISSPWEVQSAEVSDWQEAYAYLKKMNQREFRRQSTPSVSFGIIRLHGSLAGVVDGLETSTSFTWKD